MPHDLARRRLIQLASTPRIDRVPPTIPITAAALRHGTVGLP
jgi:hypothetical protein